MLLLTLLALAAPALAIGSTTTTTTTTTTTATPLQICQARPATLSRGVDSKRRTLPRSIRAPHFV